MKVHRSYSVLGHEIACEGWGLSSEKTTRDLVKDMGTDQRVMCLLAYIAETLKGVKLNVAPKPQRNEGQPSDGMLQAFRLFSEKPLPDMGQLSARSRNILRDNNCRYRSDCEPQRLCGLRNCGPVAIREITAWLNNGESHE